MLSKKKRYCTKKVANQIHEEIQLAIWMILDTRRETGEELDYLQVFELVKTDNDKQIVIKKQEIPPLEKKYEISLLDAEPINTKIWVIDEGEYETMLFPSDY